MEENEVRKTRRRKDPPSYPSSVADSYCQTVDTAPGSKPTRASANTQTEDNTMEVDLPSTASTKTKTKSAPKSKTRKGVQPTTGTPSAPQSITPGPSTLPRDSASKNTWATVTSRKAKRNTATPQAPREDFPALSAPRQTARKLPPVRNSAVLIKVSQGSTYDETLMRVRCSGIDPKTFGATVRSIRKTRGGDLQVDLGRSAKSREAAEPIRKALTEKLGQQIGPASKLVTYVDMEVVNLDTVTTANKVLGAVRSALSKANGADNPTVALAVAEFKVTSIWDLKSGHWMASITMPRSLASKEVSHVKIGWKSCRFRPRRPEVVRCFRCHGFGHTTAKCSDPDLTEGCRRCGLSDHKEAGCTAKCVACDRAGFKFLPHRPASSQCQDRKVHINRSTADFK